MNDARREAGECPVPREPPGTKRSPELQGLESGMMKFGEIVALTLAAVALILVVSGCQKQDGLAEDTGRKIDVAVEKAASDLDKSAQRAGEKIDAMERNVGEKIESTGVKMQKSSADATK